MLGNGFQEVIFLPELL